MRVSTGCQNVLVSVLLVVICFLSVPIVSASSLSQTTLFGFVEEPQSANPLCLLYGHDWHIEVISFIDWPSPKTSSYCYKETIVIDKYCTRFACGETDGSIGSPVSYGHDWSPIPTGYQCTACSLYMN